MIRRAAQAAALQNTALKEGYMKKTKYSLRRDVENAVVWLLYLTAAFILIGSFTNRSGLSPIHYNFLEISRMFQRMLAVCIALTGFHLKRRESAAWMVAVILLSTMIGVQIWFWRVAHQYLALTFEIFELLILLVFHLDYSRPSGPSGRKERVAVPVLLAVFLVLNTLTGYWMLANEGGHDLRLDKIALNMLLLMTGQYQGPYLSTAVLLYEDVVVWFDWIIVVILLFLSLKPVLEHHIDLQQRDQVLALARKYGYNSASYLALELDKRWFFSRDVEGVAAYAISSDTMVLCADPICAEENLAQFLQELRTFADRNNYKLVIFMAMEKFLPIYREMGFGALKCGEEASFVLSEYNLKGGKVAKIRAAINHARKAGLTVHEYDPRREKDPAIEHGFQQITDEWMESKHTSPLKFALGGVGFDYPNDKRYFYALDAEGGMQGFMVMLPYRNKQGYMADVTRRRPGGPYGVMEILFYDAYMQLRDEGVLYGSLGVSPLAGVKSESEGDITFMSSILNYIYEDMNCIYGFKPLHHAKAKFAPTVWDPVYIVTSPKRMTPAMGYALVNVLDSKGILDCVKAWFRHHKGDSLDEESGE